MSRKRDKYWIKPGINAVYNGFIVKVHQVLATRSMVPNKDGVLRVTIHGVQCERVNESGTTELFVARTDELSPMKP